MPFPHDPNLTVRVSNAFGRLKASATHLNSVSDDLGKLVSQLDAALQRLNLGVSQWVVVERHDGEHDTISMVELGYEKIGSKWGIAIRTRSGFADAPEEINEDAWLFSDAPRSLRIKSVDMIPEMLVKLSEAADATSEKMSKKVALVQDVVAAIVPPSPPIAQPGERVPGRK